MKRSYLNLFAAGGLLGCALVAQIPQRQANSAQGQFPTSQRQATIVGGGGGDYGKCTIEVVVDDVAQVEIRGQVGTLRTMSGQPAQWRRFECSSVMPTNASDFRFSGVDGRGRQTLIGDPRNGGGAVVQIEDRDGGSEGYTFDLTWGRGQVSQGGVPPQRGGVIGYEGNNSDRGRAYGDNGPGYRPNYRDSDYYRRYRHGFGTEEAIRLCQQTILSQATKRFRTNDIHIQRTTIDDGPGRQDWVIGTLDAHRRNGGENRMGFSCSVDFDRGTIRSATLDNRPVADDPRWH
jgi:hypothetical protein